jgi:hypothetical protein
MNINLDELGKKLHDKLDSGIDQLKVAKAHLEDVEKETKGAIQTKLNAAKEILEAKKQEASAAKARLEELVEAKKTETKAAVAEWKANHDQKKLEKRAERAEKYADDCVELALYYAAEAGRTLTRGYKFSVLMKSTHTVRVWRLVPLLTATLFQFCFREKIKMRNLILTMCVLCLSLAISACANLTAVDKPLSIWTPDVDYSFGDQMTGDRSTELLVLLAFSGGEPVPLPFPMASSSFSVCCLLR